MKKQKSPFEKMIGNRKEFQSKKGIESFLRIVEEEILQIIHEPKGKPSLHFECPHSTKITESTMETHQITQKTQKKPQIQFIKKEAPLRDYLESLGTIKMDLDEQIRKRDSSEKKETRKTKEKMKKKKEKVEEIPKATQEDIKIARVHSNLSQETMKSSQRIQFGSSSIDFKRRDKLIERSKLAHAPQKQWRHYGIDFLYEDLEREETKVLNRLSFNQESVKLKEKELFDRPFTHSFPDLPPQVSLHFPFS